jgi:hypothetical protein
LWRNIVDNSDGIVIHDSNAVTVRNNRIGRLPGVSSLANHRDGIRISGSSGTDSPIRIGDEDDAEARNVIAGDAASDHGIHVLPSVPGSARIEIGANSLYDHGGQAINRETAPDPPVLVSANPDTDIYQVQVATDAVFSNLVVNAGGLASSFFDATGLSVGTTYFWRVRASNAAGDGPYSAVWTFQSLNFPPSPEPLQPPDGTTGA